MPRWTSDLSKNRHVRSVSVRHVVSFAKWANRHPTRSPGVEARPWDDREAGLRLKAEVPKPGGSKPGVQASFRLRFYLQKLNECAKESGWLAEESLAILEHNSVAPTALKRARGIVAKARELHREYMKEKASGRCGLRRSCTPISP
jgi:hypothetical protein